MISCEDSSDQRFTWMKQITVTKGAIDDAELNDKIEAATQNDNMN